jgi:hypothetical protein
MLLPRCLSLLVSFVVIFVAILSGCNHVNAAAAKDTPSQINNKSRLDGYLRQCAFVRVNQKQHFLRVSARVRTFVSLGVLEWN